MLDRVFVALWWMGCPVKRLSNKHRYAGACWDLCGGQCWLCVLGSLLGVSDGLW